MRQPSATPGDDVVDDLGHELADRDVVEEEERLRALHRDVVDRPRDEVDADRVVATGEPGDERLRAHAVGRRHEDRLAQVAWLEREQPAEAADVAHHLGPERRAHVLLDELDRALAGGDVDAGAGVRQRLGVRRPVPSLIGPLHARQRRRRLLEHPLRVGHGRDAPPGTRPTGTRCRTPTAAPRSPR